MRNFSKVLLLCMVSIYAFGQETISKQIIHDGSQRSYIIYIPESYSGSEDVPLLFNFHGYGSTASEQMAYGNFRAIADVEGFILVHPQGALLNGVTHWNVGGWTIGSTLDDVGFTAAMIEEITSEYAIDEKRIYSTGMSNGGFMSYLLACQLSGKIAAIASVTGSMTPSTYSQCDPSHPTPVLYIHGTSDSVVPYDGATWTRKVTDVVDFWRVQNDCQEDSTIENLPDSNANDGSTVERISYLNGDAGSEVIHYKVNGGGHTWPGTAFVTNGTNLDFNASQTIWEFFSRYDIDGLRDIETAIDGVIANKDISIYPIPTSSGLTIDFNKSPNTEFTLKNAIGEIVLKGSFSNTKESIDLSTIANGSYYLNIGNSNYKVIKVD